MPQKFDHPITAGEAFARWVTRTAYSENTSRVYAARVKKFVEFIAADLDEYDQALTDEFIRDYAVRDFRAHLMREGKFKQATVEGHLSALVVFYDWLGLPKPNVKRASPERPDPKALDERDLTRVMRAAERRGIRDSTIVTLLFYSAARVSEVAMADTDDLFVSDRKGEFEIRHGKGGYSRTVPIQSDARPQIRRYLEWRRQQGHPEVGPLFYSNRGKRLAVRSIQGMVTRIAEETKTDLSPHIIRHTFARVFLAAGGDLGELQEILGHKQLTTTQVYTRATKSQLAASVERVKITT